MPCQAAGWARARATLDVEREERRRHRARRRSLVWFTISHGIVDEVYYPRVDQANTRDFGLLVSAADGWFSEEKRDTDSVVHLLGPGVPGYRLREPCREGRYEIEKTIITDPERDVLLQRMRFRALVGTLEDYRLFALLAPHIGNQGYGNDALDATTTRASRCCSRSRQDVVARRCACDAGWRARAAATSA